MNNDIVQRIADRLEENKKGVRTYASHTTAQQIAATRSAEAVTYYLGSDSSVEQGPDFIVVKVPHPELDRWAVVFILSTWMNRHGAGGYINFFEGHITM